MSKTFSKNTPKKTSHCKNNESKICEFKTLVHSSKYKRTVCQCRKINILASKYWRWDSSILIQSQGNSTYFHSSKIPNNKTKNNSKLNSIQNYKLFVIKIDSHFLCFESTTLIIRILHHLHTFNFFQSPHYHVPHIHINECMFWL